MDDDGQPDPPRDLELRLEEILLPLAVDGFPMVFVPDLADRADPLVGGQLFDSREGAFDLRRRDLLRVRRVDPDGGDDEIEFLRQPDRFLRGTDGLADVAEPLHPQGLGFEQRPATAAVEFLIEAAVVVVGVGIEEAHYRTLSPSGVSGSRKTTRTVSSPDARIMPFDSMPQRTAGLRFATTMIFLPTRSSGS